jgi:hypothetical protein
MNNLKEALFDEYNGFADKRIKKLESGSRFIIDDRGDSDIGADKQLYSYFCMMFADVLSADQVKVSLYGNVPLSKEVRNWIESNDCDFRENDYQISLSFITHKGKAHILESLANAIKSIVEPGAPRYEIPSYKYVCPRTASSLIHFMKTLKKVWKT